MNQPIPACKNSPTITKHHTDNWPLSSILLSSWNTFTNFDPAWDSENFHIDTMYFMNIIVAAVYKCPWSYA